MADDERRRLAEPSGARTDWDLWGPYLSERQWGTVREDYSADGSAWTYLPHDHARSRAYRWGEDGLAGFSDREQRLCLGIALWNGRDPILKERPFGLAGPEGNHGEDVKDYWWYLDAVPSHAWNRWRYHYPQGEFPYADLVAENGRRGRHDPEYELLDTGVFDQDRFWIVDVTYAKASQTDLLMSVRVTNAGPEREVVHVLPTAWFRNTWTWTPDAQRPKLAAIGNAVVGITHPVLGELELLTAAASGRDHAVPAVLRQRDQHQPPVRRDVTDSVSERRHQRSCRVRGGHDQPGASRYEVRRLVPPFHRPGCHRRAPAAAAAHGVELPPADGARD